MEGYLNSAKFLTKMLVVSVIVINGIVLNFVVTPKLGSLNFGPLVTPEDQKMKTRRHLTFAAGAVSITSWWAAFILGVMNVSPAPLYVLVSLYVVILCIAVISSQIIEQLVSRQKLKNVPFL